MTLTTFDSSLEVQNWRQSYFLEYVRGNLYSPYMGEDSNKPIQFVMDLKKKKGDNIRVNLVHKLGGSGILGDNTLKGNEQVLNAYADVLTVTQRRQAVAMSEFEEMTGAIDLLDAAKPQLMEWEKEQLKTDITDAWMSHNLDGYSTYSESTQAEMDEWLENNSDRVLFGAALSNTDATGGSGPLATYDFSSSLSAVDSTTDVLSPAMVSLARRVARSADPHIKPFKVKNEEEWYVMFCNQYSFRDLKNHPTMQQAMREAEVRGRDNPIWSPGDLIYDGVILREIPENTALSSVGASSINVGVNTLVGAQGIGIAWAVMPEFRFEDDDYQNINGVAVREVLGVQKLHFNKKAHGCVSVFAAAVADT